MSSNSCCKFLSHVNIYIYIYIKLTGCLLALWYTYTRVHTVLPTDAHARMYVFTLFLLPLPICHFHVDPSIEIFKMFATIFHLSLLQMWCKTVTTNWTVVCVEATRSVDETQLPFFINVNGYCGIVARVGFWFILNLTCNNILSFFF